MDAEQNKILTNLQTQINAMHEMMLDIHALFKPTKSKAQTRKEKHDEAVAKGIAEFKARLIAEWEHEQNKNAGNGK